MYIKARLEAVCSLNGVTMSSPPVSYCTDNGVMIAWNGCERMLSRNGAAKEIVVVESGQQDQAFFDSLKPIGKCELGEDISKQIKLLQIKN